MSNEKITGTMSNGVERVNRFALIILSIIDFFLVVGYANEGVKGGISPVFAIVFVTIVIGTMLVACITY